MNDALIGIALVVCCAMIEGFAQVCLKKSALADIGKSFWITLGVAFFVFEAVLYTGALYWLDLSSAYPLGALSFASVIFFSHWILKETVDARRWIGLVLILTGCALVAAQGS